MCSTGRSDWFWTKPHGTVDHSDTLGNVGLNGSDNPVPIVVIGHTDDPRSRHCPPGAEVGCAGDFVADRIAWAGGAEPADRVAYSYADDHVVTPTLDLEACGAALGAGQQILSAVAISADGVRSMDPALELYGRQDHVGRSIGLVGAKLNGVVRSNQSRDCLAC